jgi:hypothetical protein
MPSIALWTLT